MTDDMMKTATTLTEALDAQRAQNAETEVIPEKPPAIAEILPPVPGEAPLTLLLSLSEIGCIVASIQTSVRSGWIRQPSDVNVANSVLRKVHEAKLQYVKEHP